jgi:hypothetical protein
VICDLLTRCLLKILIGAADLFRKADIRGNHLQIRENFLALTKIMVFGENPSLNFPRLPKLKSAFGRSLPKRNWPIFPALGSIKTCKGTLIATNIAPQLLKYFFS